MKITVLDGYPLNPGDISWEPIEELGELTVFQDTPKNLVAERIHGADIVLTNKTPLGKEHIKALADCKMIGVLATGTNILNIPAINEAGITICNVPGYGVGDVAEHALALLLELAKGTAFHSAGVKAGEWGRRGWCYWDKAPLALHGLTMGIIGFGAIGQALGKYAHALGMKILAFSPSQKAKTDYPFRYAPLLDIFSESDVISLHCPLTPKTKHIINKNSLALMKENAILLNTARGELVDEWEVAEALKTGKIAGLGTDVLSTEPPGKDNPLLTAPNTIITPHMAWATRKARQNIISIMAENIRAFAAGKPIHTV